ncbi:hypothetical protein JKY72_03925 [Candidatus Gracilibacteria bacterium]|nr:hypothetical protein [Candidatus Gracilibacteria bacterium]
MKSKLDTKILAAVATLAIAGCVENSSQVGASSPVCADSIITGIDSLVASFYKDASGILADPKAKAKLPSDPGSGLFEISDEVTEGPSVFTDAELIQCAERDSGAITCVKAHVGSADGGNVIVIPPVEFITTGDSFLSWEQRYINDGKASSNEYSVVDRFDGVEVIVEANGDFVEGKRYLNDSPCVQKVAETRVKAINALRGVNDAAYKLLVRQRGKR